MRNWGFLLIRVVFGLTLAAHGAQKALGWFGGSGLAATAKGFEALGLKPGYLMAFLAGWGEIAGGLLLAAGVLWPVATFLVFFTMAVATVKVTGPKGFFLKTNGMEYTLSIAAVGAGLFLTGPGEFTVKALIEKFIPSKSTAKKAA